MKFTTVYFALVACLASNLGTAAVQVMDGSELVVQQSYKESANTINTAFLGYSAQGYLKHVKAMEARYSGELANKAVRVGYVVFPLKKLITRSADGALLPFEGDEMKIRGVIEHVNNGTTNDTWFHGFLMNDERTIVSSWFFSTNCTLVPPTDFSKVKATLKKPLAVPASLVGTNLPNPIWLFKIGTNYSLSIQP